LICPVEEMKMRKTFAVLAAATMLYACHSNSPSPESDFPTGNSVVPGSVSGANQTPTAEPAETTSPAGIKITNSGNVLNPTGTTYTACLFDAPYGEGQLIDEWKAKPGKTSFSYESDSCAPLVGQIDIIDRAKCPNSPHGLVALAANPNVRIPAFGGTWEPKEPIRENVSEWSECQPVEFAESTHGHKPPKCEPEKVEGQKIRTFDLVLYEVNSCSEQLREVRRTTKQESRKCSFETGEKVCDAGIVHTENEKWCGYTFVGHHLKYVCQKNWFLFSEKKWQCQGVPPGVPGHYPNHFDHPQHDDYFGEPDEEHCYDIRN
jgi:hypothetical protein